MITPAVQIQNKQPKALWLLVAAQMWECFSFYGMRALLVLYLVSHMKFSDAKALGIYAVYTGLVELGGIVGGMIADKFLGLRRAIFIGGWLIASGHIVLSLQSNEETLFLGLGLIIVGSSLFSANISALLGQFYEKDDARREEGFTLFYVGINLGALLASLLCGAIGEAYGWHYGFSLAAFGMIMGNVALYFFRNILEDRGQPKRHVQKRKKLMLAIALIVCPFLFGMGMAQAELLLVALPWLSIVCVGYVVNRLRMSATVSRRALMTLCFSLVAAAIFFAAEEQIGSSLMLFSERLTTSSIAGLAIPATVLLSVNPLTILLIGPFLNRLSKRFTKEESSDATSPKKMGFALALSGIAFAGLALMCLSGYGLVPMSGVMLSVFVISFAELFVGPAVYNCCSEIAPEGEEGAVMGLVPLGFSLASFLGGHLSQLMAIPEEGMSQALTIYGEGFAVIAILLVVTSVLMLACSTYFRERARACA